jgi:integrase
VRLDTNPIRRDLNLFYLVTGLRRDDGKSVLWEHVDFDAGTIHRPKPKGGVDRAFTVPVSTFVLELLRRRREENLLLFPDGDAGLVFPGRRLGGRIKPIHEARVQVYDEEGNKTRPLPSPHRLRHTFATAGHEAYLRELDLKILMNHAQPLGNVTHGYVRASVGHLRACVETVAAFLLEKAGVDPVTPR